MNLRKLAVTLSLLLTACLPALAQTDTISINTIVTKAVKYNADYPFEKVYLHLDKPYYAVGDTIWFKAYLTNDVTVNDDMTKNKHLPSSISKVLYVDVLTSKDSTIQRIKLPITDGTAIGDIVLLKGNYKEGNYHIKAYTNWMRNFDPVYFFNKTIPIGTLVDKNVFSSINLSGQFKSSTAKVDAVIHYYTADGRDYAGRKVSWKVQNTDDESISKGKGTTDAKGNINISFNTNKTEGLGKASLVAGIEINNNTFVNSYPLKNVASPVDVQFFPEGGDLITGIKSKVAFKAIKPDGLGADVKGTIIDNSGATVATVSAQHLGMGVFELEPQAGKTYKATLTFADGSQNTYDLPKPKEAGITFTVNNSDPEKLTLTVSANDAYFLANKYKKISILGQSGQVICYGGQSALVAKTYSATIAKSKFPSGVALFTIFAANGDPLAERVVFIQRNDQLKIGLTTAKTTYGVRDPVAFNVTAKTAANQPALANLSVTVLDDKKVPFDEDAETTILTNQLLSSDLKGYIEKPNYYFNKTNDKTAADLDVLMLTQGYRRIVYKDVFTNKQPAIKFWPEDGIEITGSLRTSAGMAVPRGVLNFYIKNMKISAIVSTNPEGEFKISKLFFPDSVKAVINAKGTYNANNLMIMLNTPTAQAPTPNFNAADEVINIDTVLNAYLQNNKKFAANSRVLKEVIIKEQKAEKKVSHQDFTTLVGLSSIPDHVIDGKRLANCGSLYECLRAILPGITYDQDKLYITRDYNAGKKVEVSIYLDGMIVDFPNLFGIPTESIDQIEIFNNEGLSGVNRMNGTNGVVVISSKKTAKPKLDRELLAQLTTSQYSAVNFTPKGYYMARAFYSPKYDASKSGSFGGDLRTTIYWNPKVLTDKDGNATFDFFNADGTGTYRAIVEGIDSNGNIGRTLYRYTVK
jgi:hypothetical protein